jgi:hypothetical protein
MAVDKKSSAVSSLPVSDRLSGKPSLTYLVVVAAAPLVRRALLGRLARSVISVVTLSSNALQRRLIQFSGLGDNVRHEFERCAKAGDRVDGKH